MKQDKAELKKKRRNLWVLGITAAVLLIALIVILCIVTGRKGRKTDGDSQLTDKPSQSWDARIADLENEPVSDMDVVYKDKSASD